MYYKLNLPLPVLQRYQLIFKGNDLELPILKSIQFQLCKDIKCIFRIIVQNF